ncbi:ABC transporter permease [Spirillospora sp. CA-255316]
MSQTAVERNAGTADSDVAASPTRRRRKGLVGNQVSRYGGLYIWAVLIVVFALWLPDTFFTAATARSIAGDQAITVILALGLLISLAGGAYDLSIAQNLGLSAAFAAWLMADKGLNPWIALVVTIGLGAAIGVVNGVLVAVIGLNSFIATLGTGSVLLAITEIVTSSNFVGPVPANFQNIATAQPGGIPILFIYALIAAVIAWYALQHSPVGRRLQATGTNPDAARLAGVRTSRYVFTALIVAGIVGSLAGALAAAKISSVSPSVGPPYLLPAFAACFLGMTQFKPGRFNVWGTVVALYLLQTGVKGLQLAGGQLWVTEMFNGVALVGAVSIAVLSEKRRARGTH